MSPPFGGSLFQTASVIWCIHMMLPSSLRQGRRENEMLLPESDFASCKLQCLGSKPTHWGPANYSSPWPIDSPLGLSAEVLEGRGGRNLLLPVCVPFSVIVRWPLVCQQHWLQSPRPLYTSRSPTSSRQAAAPPQTSGSQFLGAPPLTS